MLKIKNEKLKHILKASIRMGTATMISRILGLLREQTMAFIFGASSLTDAFLVAYRIPNLLRDLLAEGAFSSAFIPTFTEENNRSKDDARKLLWKLFFALVFITSILSILMIIFAPELVSLFSPSFKNNPEKFELTVNLTRIMSPYLVFVSVAALFMGALNTLKIFFIPALAPASFNIVMILATLILSSIFISCDIQPIYALALGVFFGGLTQALIQFPFLIKNMMAPKLVRNIFDEKTKEVFKKLGPGMLGFAATQINLLINTILATGTVVGAVSCLTYAFRLFQFPVGILGVSIGNTNLVLFSEALKQNRPEDAKHYLLESYSLSFIIMFPALILMMGLSEQIVHLLFEHGNFERSSTIMTALALNAYLLGLPFYGIYKILVPVFYALNKQKIPVYTSIVSILINIIFCIALIETIGFSILALGTSLSMLINVLIMMVYIKKELKIDYIAFINNRVLKSFWAGTLTYILLIIIKNLIFNYDDSFILKIFEVFLLSLIGVLFYSIWLIIFSRKK